MDTLPYNIFINKLFQRPEKSAEAQLALNYFENQETNSKNSLFHKLRTAQVDWSAPEFSAFPSGLSHELFYWVVPWADKQRPTEGFISKIKRRLSYKKVEEDFFTLCNSFKTDGYRKGKPIKGYLLVHQGKKYFQYTDGNRRLGIISSLIKLGQISSELEIEVDIRGTFDLENLKNNKASAEIIKKYNFSNEDINKWVNHVISK